MKKFFVTIICILLCAATFAQNGTFGEISWSISGGTLTISKSSGDGKIIFLN
jgi:preprotein translocase subunit SecG